MAKATRKYDGLGRQKNLYWRSGDAGSSTYIEKYDYTYNSANQRETLAVTGRSDRPNATLEFTYDGYGQLTGANTTWSSGSVPGA